MNFLSAKFIHVGYREVETQWSTIPHFHEYHEMIVHVAGKTRVVSERKQLTASAGDVLVYPAHVAHLERALETGAHYYISFILTDVGSSIHRICDEDGRIRKMSEWMHEDCSQPGHGKSAKIELLMRAITAEFFERLGETSNDTVVRTQHYIRTRISAALNLEALARNASMSKYHFLRTFKLQSGRTPMDEVRSIRLDYARDLLITTELSVKEVANKVGFGSEDSMSRRFREKFSMPPSEFRRRFSQPSPGEMWIGSPALDKWIEYDDE